MSRATKQIRAYRHLMTKEQYEWCKNYHDQTGFEALMDDFAAGNETFVHAAHKSNLWFENWSTDAHLNITRSIPGVNEECVARLRDKGA